MSAAAAVAIHLAPELAPEFALRTLKSCEAALGAEQCRLTDEPTSEDEFYATVTSDREDATAHIVLVHRGRTQATAERDIAFAPEDPPGDRWASVGVVIAALVTAESGRAPAPPRPKPAPPPPKPRPAAAPRPAEHPVRIDVLAQLARDTRPTYPAVLGGVLRIALAPARSPFFASAGGGYAARVTPQPDIAIASASAGGGFRWGRPDARWGGEVHAEGLAQWWSLTASEPGRSDSKVVWRFGGAAGVDGTWGFLPGFQAVVGVTIQVVAPRVDVDVRGQSTEWVPPVGASVVGGFRFVP